MWTYALYLFAFIGAMCTGAWAGMFVGMLFAYRNGTYDDAQAFAAKGVTKLRERRTSADNTVQLFATGVHLDEHLDECERLSTAPPRPVRRSYVARNDETTRPVLVPCLRAMRASCTDDADDSPTLPRVLS